jgi:hypothetical protein
MSNIGYLILVGGFVHAAWTLEPGDHSSSTPDFVVGARITAVVYCLLSILNVVACILIAVGPLLPTAVSNSFIMQRMQFNKNMLTGIIWLVSLLAMSESVWVSIGYGYILAITTLMTLCFNTVTIDGDTIIMLIVVHALGVGAGFGQTLKVTTTGKVEIIGEIGLVGSHYNKQVDSKHYKEVSFAAASEQKLANNGLTSVWGALLSPKMLITWICSCIIGVGFIILGVYLWE